MCMSSALSNGRCVSHGGRKGTELTFSEANQSLATQYLRGGRRDTLQRIMANPEDALSNADTIFLLSVRMSELTEGLGAHTLNVDDVETLSNLREMLDDRQVIAVVDDLIAELYERNDDEVIWDKLNDQAQNLNKLRVGQSTILRNTQMALSEAQKRKLGEKIINAIQLGVNNAVAVALPLIQQNSMAITDARLLITDTLIKEIKKEMS